MGAREGHWSEVRRPGHFQVTLSKSLPSPGLSNRLRVRAPRESKEVPPPSYKKSWTHNTLRRLQEVPAPPALAQVLFTPSQFQLRECQRKWEQLKCGWWSQHLACIEGPSPASPVELYMWDQFSLQPTLGGLAYAEKTQAQDG